MKFGTLTLALLLCAGAAHATGDDSDTLNPLPSVSPSATSYTATRTFLKNEDADRFDEMFDPHAATGCIHGVPGSGKVGTFSPTPCIAYPGGFRISEAATTVNYAAAGASNTDVCWLDATAAASGNSGNFVRIGSTHYTADCVSSSRPNPPTDGMELLKVTITGGSISAVQDLRRLSPIMYSGLRTKFSSIVVDEAKFAYATDTTCLYIGDGSTVGGILIGCGTDEGSSGGGSDATTHCIITRSFNDVVSAGQEVMMFRFPFGCTCPTNFVTTAGTSTFSAPAGGATASSAFTFYKATNAECNQDDYNFVSFGTATFPALQASSDATLATTATHFAAGDCFRIKAPVSLDATLDIVNFTLVCDPD